MNILSPYSGDSVQSPPSFNLISCRSDVDSVELASMTRHLLKERCDEWVQQLFGEKSVQVSSAILSLLADWYGTGQRVSITAQSQLLELTKKSLKCEGHQVSLLWVNFSLVLLDNF